MAQQIDNKNLRKQLEILGVEAVAVLTRILTEEDKRASGELIRSLDFKVIQDVNGLLLSILAADYFKYVDQGRRPGKQPPIKPIQSWVKQKNIVFRGLDDRQTAFLIARSIGKKGIKPINAKQRMINEVMKNAGTILKVGAVKDIESLIEKTFIKEIKNI